MFFSVVTTTIMMVIIYTEFFRLVDIIVGGDFLGLCDQKIHINMCPILDGYGVMGQFYNRNSQSKL
jgi:hypothetical protein